MRGFDALRSAVDFPIGGFYLDTAAWSVCIDNLSEDEIFAFEDWKEVFEDESACMTLADTRYDQWRSPGPGDDLRRSPCGSRGP